MQKENLPKLSYGDKVLITYRQPGQEDDPRGVKFPPIGQGMGFFVELEGSKETPVLHLSRNNPGLVGELDDLPELGEMGPQEELWDGTTRQYNKRILLLDETFYLTEDIIRLEVL